MITRIIDRGGRRIRFYERTTPGPTKAERRVQAAAGMGWCRCCIAWLSDVRLGLCRTHRNGDYRSRYRGELGQRVRARVASRRWATANLPKEAASYISETFGGRCAYCPKPATTWDHFVPVAAGGRTVPGNMVPACKSCNSRKRSRDPFDFISDQPVANIHPMTWDRIVLAEMAGVFSG